MGRPQQPELARSGKTPLGDPDSIAGDVEAHRRPTDDDKRRAPVPEENRPGHHPEQEQDQPDPKELARSLGVHGDPQPEGPDHEPDVSPARRALERGAGVSITAARAGRSFIGRVIDTIRRRPS
jgi:hypothetical protein